MHGVTEAKGGVFTKVLPLDSKDLDNTNNNSKNRGGTCAVIDGRKSAEDGNQSTPTPSKSNEDEIITIGSISDEKPSTHTSKVRYLLLKK